MARSRWHNNGPGVRLDPGGIVSPYRPVYRGDNSGATLELGFRNGRHQHRHCRKRVAPKEIQDAISLTVAPRAKDSGLT
jgi:hypothetical protein